jgi:NADH dehydrogenase
MDALLDSIGSSPEPLPAPQATLAAVRRRPHVVVIGAGFAGLSAVRALKRTPVDITLIDRRNHHLFQPLLYQVATAGLAPNQIANPTRAIVAGQKNVRVVLAEVDEIDVVQKQVVTGRRRTGFDYLVVATGAAHAYFGRDDWARFAPGLKSLDDALALRRRVLTAFEAAETACDPVEVARLLTFVVVGGGPTGVELAGAIAELARRALDRDFRAIKGVRARVLLVEAGPRLLPSFHMDLSAYAKTALEALGVDVLLGQAVSDCDATGVALGPRRIGAATVVWAAGVGASPLGRWLPGERDRAGRVAVESDLSLEAAPDVFVTGDLALILRGDGRPVPGVAPAAKQQGAFAASAIIADVTGKRRPPAFRYRDAGALATIGRRAAVVELGRLRMTGALAWAFWCAAHVWFLIGFRNRLQVTLDWLWSYLTFERGSRLITGEDQAREALNDHVAGRCACHSL